MNMLGKLNFSLAVVLALSFVAFADNSAKNKALDVAKESDVRPVVEVEVYGKKISAPLNENIQVSEARRNFDKETIENLFAALAKIVDLAVVEKAGHWSMLMASKSVISKAWSSASNLKKLRKSGDSTPPMAHGYANKMGKLIQDIVDIRTAERINDEETKVRADTMLEAIKKITQQSSTGLYLDWTMLTVDGQPIAQYLAPVLQWFRDNGYSKELQFINIMGKVVKSFSTSQKEI